MEQWFKDNWVLVTGIGFAGSIIYLAAVFGKPLLSVVVSLWTHVTRLRIVSAAQSLDLRFVLMPWRSTLSVMHRDGEQPNADIRTHWKVTNLSPPAMPPARLLTARLVKPRLRDTRIPNAPTESTNAMVVSVDGELIPRGHTREVDIHFYVVLPAGKLNKPMRLKIIVTDQLSNEHKLPPVTLNPIIIETTQTRPRAS
jgi:hypothetical protein